MNRWRLINLLDVHDASNRTHLLDLAEHAEAEGWGDVVEYLRVGFEAGLGDGGLWQCDHCLMPTEDPAHPHATEGCICLADASGTGGVVLCHDCHAAAAGARKKIVVTEVTDDYDNVVGTEEDDSALTDDERRLAAYLDAADEGVARQSREIIGSYPRNERRQLHRYQDQIDAKRRTRGKTLA